MEDFQCFSDEQLQQMSVSGSVGAEDALAARYNQLGPDLRKTVFSCRRGQRRSHAGGDAWPSLRDPGVQTRAGRPFQGVCGTVHPAADLQCDQIGVLFEAYPSQQRRIAGGCVRQRRHPVPVCMRPLIYGTPRKNRFWRESAQTNFSRHFPGACHPLNRRSCRCI